MKFNSVTVALILSLYGSDVGYAEPKVDVASAWQVPGGFAKRPGDTVTEVTETIGTYLKRASNGNKQIWFKLSTEDVLWGPFTVHHYFVNDVHSASMCQTTDKACHGNCLSLKHQLASDWLSHPEDGELMTLGQRSGCAPVIDVGLFGEDIEMHFLDHWGLEGSYSSYIGMKDTRPVTYEDYVEGGPAVGDHYYWKLVEVTLDGPQPTTQAPQPPVTEVPAEVIMTTAEPPNETTPAPTEEPSPECPTITNAASYAIDCTILSCVSGFLPSIDKKSCAPAETVQVSVITTSVGASGLVDGDFAYFPDGEAERTELRAALATDFVRELTALNSRRQSNGQQQWWTCDVTKITARTQDADVAATFAFNEVATSASKDEEAVRADVSTVFKKPGLLASFSEVYQKAAENSTLGAFSVQTTSVQIEDMQTTVSHRAVTLYKTETPATLSPAEESDEGGPSPGIFVIVVPVVVICIAIISAALCYFHKKSNAESTGQTLQMQGMNKMHTMNAKVDEYNPLSPQRRFSPRVDEPAPVVQTYV